MADLGDAYINIIPKAPGIKSELTNMVGGAGDGAGKSFGSGFAGAFKKIMVAAGIGTVLKQAFEAGGDLQQSFGGLDTIYGEAAAGAKQFAMEAAAAGISANSYAEQAVSFGAALKQAYGGDTTAAMNAANTAIMDMADNSAKMGTDIGSIQAAYQGFAKQNYTMLDNLKLGYGGTKEEMERLLADASELSGVEYNIDNLGDVYDAIHVIQEDLGLTGVAASEAETTLTGSFGALKASWTNLMAAMTTGEGLDEAITNLVKSVGNFGRNVLTMFGNIGQQLPQLMTGLLSGISTTLVPMAGEAITGFINGIVANLPQIVATGIELLGQLVAGILQAIPDLIAAVPQIFSSAVEAFRGQDWAGIGRNIIAGIINGIKAAGSNLFEMLKSLAKDALEAAKEKLGINSPSKVFADEVGSSIPEGIALGIAQNSNYVSRAIDAAVNTMTDEYQRATATGSITAAARMSETDRLINALRDLKVSTVVTLQGDTRKLFKVVSDTNNARTKATGYNALAAVGV